MIVFDDADIDLAVRMVIASKYRNAGQTCISGNRVLVHRKIQEQFTTKLAERVSKMKVGHGLKEGISIGPLIDHMAREKAKTHVADAVAKGGTLVVGGYEASTEQLGDDRLQGSFYVPTILVDSNTQMKTTN